MALSKEYFPFPYVKMRTFSDPTPLEALKNIKQATDCSQEKTKREKSQLASEITIIREQLEDLNKKRRSGEISRRDFCERRPPLLTEYQTLSQAHLAERRK